MEKTRLEISGMTCGHCVAAVRNALAELPGVEISAVSIGSAEFSYDGGQTPLAQIVQAIQGEGYEVGPTQLRRAQPRDGI